MVSSRTSFRTKYREGQFYRSQILANPEEHTDPEHWNRVLNTCQTFSASREWVDFMHSSHVVSPNLFTYNKLLQRTENYYQALSVLDEMNAQHIQQDAWTTNILIHKWFKDFETAISMVQGMPCPPNQVTFQVLSDLARTSEQMYLVMDLMDYWNYEYNYRIWHNLLRVAPRRTEAERFYNIMQRCGVKPSAKTRAIMRNWRSK
jgi:hypothetical protein